MIVCVSVCLYSIDSKSIERIFMRFSPMHGVIREEGLGVKFIQIKRFHVERLRFQE